MSRERAAPVPRIRVLVCEDSRAYATGLRRMLEYEGDIEVVAMRQTAEDAIASLPRLAPDLVTMDVRLAGMDGLTAIAEIMGTRPVPILVISAYLGAQGEAEKAEAIAAGALDWLAKDDLDLREPSGAAGAAFRRRIKMLSRARVVRRPRLPIGSETPPGRRGRDASVIGVCASTGGPQILASLLESLPPDYPIPLLVVQHLIAGFTDGLVRWLDQAVPLPVRAASDGDLAAPGVWIAPEGAHLRIAASGRLHLDPRELAGPHRPSGDVLLGSIAVAAGRTGVAVVLSGMGKDGAAGAAAVHAAGGLAMAQDEASSVVYGMPRAAADHGVDLVLPPKSIAVQMLGLRYAPLPGARS